MIISVVGGHDARTDTLQKAYEVGRLLAQHKIVVACGGLMGVMEAVCCGAKNAGGTTLGILPGNDPGEANSWVDICVCTGMGYARNAIVVKTGASVIALNGAYGTLSEIGHALSEGIGVVGLDTWSLQIANGPKDGIVLATTPQEAVDKAIILGQQRLEHLAQGRSHT